MLLIGLSLCHVAIGALAWRLLEHSELRAYLDGDVLGVCGWLADPLAGASGAACPLL